MKVRTCWSALESKTEELLSQLRLASAQAQQLRDSLLSSQQRLDQMYQEYHAQSLQTGSSSGMADALNQRNFMAQLSVLRDRVRQDIAKSDQHLDLLEQRLLQAQTQKIKIQALMEIDQKAVRHHVRVREQSSMDELGLLQFNRARAG